MSKPKKLHYAFIILLAVSLIRGFSGPAINASSGLFLTPVAQDLDIGIGKLSLYLSISSIVSMLWLPVAGKLLNQYSVKAVAIVSAFLQTAAFLSLGFMNSVWGWYVLSVPLALGSTLLVNLLGPVLVNRWFSVKQGVVMGLMMTITSLLGAVFQPLLTQSIDEKGWRFTYITFGAVAFVIMTLIILIFLKNRPEEKRIRPFGYEDNHQTQEHSKRTLPGITSKEAIRSSAFYLLLLFIIILTGFAAFFQYITNYGINLNYTITNIGTALSASMIGSAIGSILIGLCCDKFGAIFTCVGVMLTGLISIILFFLGGNSFIIFIAATFFYGLTTSSIGVVTPLLTIAYFGAKDYEKLYSWLMMGSPFASIILMPAYGFIYDLTGSYQSILIFLLAALIAGAAFVFIGHRTSRKLYEIHDTKE